MLELDQWLEHRDQAAAEDAVSRWGDVPALLPEHTLVVTRIRHKHDGRVRLPGQVYWMQDARVLPNVESGLISAATSIPCDYWSSPRRILGAEDVAAVRPFASTQTPGALKILSGCAYDPGSAAFRFHTAVNEWTKHSVAFVRWGDGNPHCSLRQFDGEKDIGLVRDAFLQADVLHCHVAYLLVNNVGLMPTDKQLLVRHYHGSKPDGGTHMEPIFDQAKNAKILGARLSLVAEGARHGLDVDWSPIPMPVKRYQALCEKARKAAKWKPLPGKASIKRKLRIGHSPTNMSIKGTDVLRKVVEQLQAKHVPVELDLIHGLGLREALERKALCDVVFDSFWLGIQGSGLEAGAMEIPVIAGDLDVQFLYRKELGHVPYTIANDQRDLANVIEQIAMDASFRERETVALCSYVNTVHDYAAVAKRYEQTLAKWLGRDDVITETL